MVFNVIIYRVGHATVAFRAAVTHDKHVGEHLISKSNSLSTAGAFKNAVSSSGTATPKLSNNVEIALFWQINIKLYSSPFSELHFPIKKLV